MKNQISLAKHVEQYIALRRTMGAKLTGIEYVFNDFLKFFKGSYFIKTGPALEWAKKTTGTTQRAAKRLLILRSFAEYMHSMDKRHEVPPTWLLPFKYERITPYIYSNMNISDICAEAGRLKSPKGLRGITYSTFFKLLAVTGMRLSECINLIDEDVDLKKGRIFIRNTKFGKSRWIPIHPTVVIALRKYQATRKKFYSRRISAFFLSEKGKKLGDRQVSETFNQIVTNIGLKSSSRHTPKKRVRIHDLRHTFAVRVLETKLKNKGDDQHVLSILSTYLGHINPCGTYWYLTATGKLLNRASNKLEKHLGEQK